MALGELAEALAQRREAAAEMPDSDPPDGAPLG